MMTSKLCRMPANGPNGIQNNTSIFYQDCDCVSNLSDMHSLRYKICYIKLVKFVAIEKKKIIEKLK